VDKIFCDTTCDALGIPQQYVIEVFFSEDMPGTYKHLLESYGDDWVTQTFVTDCKGGFGGVVYWTNEDDGFNWIDYANVDLNGCGSVNLTFFDYYPLELPAP